MDFKEIFTGAWFEKSFEDVSKFVNDIKGDPQHYSLGYWGENTAISAWIILHPKTPEDVHKNLMMIRDNWLCALDKEEFRRGYKLITGEDFPEKELREMGIL